jgi:hypothetical protein
MRGFDIALVPNATADVSYSVSSATMRRTTPIKGDVTWLF